MMSILSVAGYSVSPSTPVAGPPWGFYNGSNIKKVEHPEVKESRSKSPEKGTPLTPAGRGGIVSKEPYRTG